MEWANEWAVFVQKRSNTAIVLFTHIAIWIDICLCFDKWIYTRLHRVYSKPLVGTRSRCIDRELREFKYINTWTVYLNECMPLGNNQQHQFIHLFNLRTIASHFGVHVYMCDRASSHIYIWKPYENWNGILMIKWTWIWQRAIIKTSQHTAHTQNDNYERMR